jgi:hypothetical protein
MTLQDSSAGGRAVDGVGSRAVALVVALFVVNAAWNVLLNTLVAGSGLAAAARLAYDVTLPLSTAGAAAGLAAATVVGVVLLAALARSATPETDALGAGESAGETLLAYGRAVVVAVVGAVAAAAGLAAVLVPGLLVSIHLPLVFVAVAADGDSIGRAVARSWSKARGSRGRIAAVGLAVAAVPLAVALIALFTDLLSPLAELAVGVVVTTVAAAVGVVAFAALGASLDGLQTGSSGTDSVTPSGSRQL